jgi:DNA-binding transcriptional LysR family regulator
LTLQQLTYFIATAEHGSFNAAARALFCSQPAVSDPVRKLEAELGVALFVRQGRGLALSSAGRTFLGHARAVVDASEEAAASVGRGSFRRPERVAMGTFRNAPYYLVSELAASFARHHPEARLRLPGHNSAAVAAAVRAGELEAGLVGLPVEDRGLEVRPLFRDEVLFVSADPGRTAEPVSIETFAAGPLALYDAGFGIEDPTRRQVAARAQRAGLALDPRFDVEHVETALQLTAMGLAHTMAARSVTLDRAFPPTLHAVPFADPLFDTFALVTRSSGVVSSGTQRLLDLVDDWAADVRRHLQAR